MSDKDLEFTPCFGDDNCMLRPPEWGEDLDDKGSEVIDKLNTEIEKVFKDINNINRMPKSKIKDDDITEGAIDGGGILDKMLNIVRDHIEDFGMRTNTGKSTYMNIFASLIPAVLQTTGQIMGAKWQAKEMEKQTHLAVLKTKAELLHTKAQLLVIPLQYTEQMYKNMYAKYNVGLVKENIYKTQLEEQTLCKQKILLENQANETKAKEDYTIKSTDLLKFKYKDFYIDDDGTEKHVGGLIGSEIAKNKSEVAARDAMNYNQYVTTILQAWSSKKSSDPAIASPGMLSSLAVDKLLGYGMLNFYGADPNNIIMPNLPMKEFLTESEITSGDLETTEAYLNKLVTKNKITKEQKQIFLTALETYPVRQKRDPLFYYNINKTEMSEFKDMYKESITKDKFLAEQVK